MTTYTCPEGHTSADSDYCDVCGSPIGAAGSSSGVPAATQAASSAQAGGAGGSMLDLGGPAPDPGPATPAAPAGQVCPSCSAAAPADALFCENCGYDFITGQLPRPLSPPDGTAAPSAPAPSSPAPSSLAPPSDAQTVPDAPAPDTVPDALPGASANTTPDAFGGAASPDPAASADPLDADPADSNVHATLQPPPSDPANPVLPPSAQPQTTVEWVAELWVDPDWHDAQDVDDPCPSPGMPAVVPLHSRSVLVGRSSASRNIHPDVEVVGDTGVSRRHAQLTSDGRRWWVEDLQSANGTYVGATGASLPTVAIAPGQRVEVGEDARIYLGAWTRLVLRKALPGEA